jgi:peptide/nickel transport system substrate-binding protein
VAWAVSVALAVTGLVAAAPASAAQAPKLFRIGWAHDPQTLNPFVDLDIEDYDVWSIDWDTLVGYSPKDLAPVPGLARSWSSSPDKRTVTFHLVPDAKWSDGQPITSADVKYSLETLGGHGALFTSYTSTIRSIRTPDPDTVVITTKRPDARIIGGLAVYILPKHVWSRYPVKKLLGNFKPPFPLVGSGPYVVTKFQHDHIIEMRRNPYWRGPRPKFDGIQFIKYGTQDAAQRALQLGEVDYVHDVDSSSFARLGKLSHVRALSAPSPSFTQLTFNLCSKAHCPDAKYNPAVQDRTVRQAIAYAIDRNRLNQIAARGTSFVGHGLLPSYYKSFYAVPAQDYPHDVAKANQMLDAAGWKKGSDGIRAKNGERLQFDLAVRNESSYDVQLARLVAEMGRDIGVDFNVDVMSTDRLTEITAQKKDGKPAPDYDTFIWGWGGDTYDPSTLLNLLTTSAIGSSSDSFYSNPEYDRLYEEQLGEFDKAARAQTVKRMIAIAQRDLPYLVLTTDPELSAYRTDRVSGARRQCPEPNGDLICEATSFEPWLTLGPPTAAAATDGGGSSSGIVVGIVVAVLVVLALVLWIVRRRRAAAAPLEVPEG